MRDSARVCTRSSRIPALLGVQAGPSRAACRATGGRSACRPANPGVVRLVHESSPRGDRARLEPGIVPEGGSALRKARAGVRAGTHRFPRWFSAGTKLLGVHRAIPRGDSSRPLSGAVGDTAEPGTQGFIDPNRMSPADQYQERRLKSIVHIMRVAKNLVADGQDHRPMAMDQLAKSQLASRVPSLRKPPQKLSVTQPGHRPCCPEHFEPWHFACLASAGSWRPPLSVCLAYPCNAATPSNSYKFLRIPAWLAKALLERILAFGDR